MKQPNNQSQKKCKVKGAREMGENLRDSSIQQVTNPVSFTSSPSDISLAQLKKEKVEWIEANLHINIYIAKKGIKKGEITYDRI